MARERRREASRRLQQCDQLQGRRTTTWITGARSHQSKREEGREQWPTGTDNQTRTKGGYRL